MRDPDIRQLLLPVIRQAAPQALLVSEYGGLRGVVADVATFAPTGFNVWEIKSDHDSLRRLPGQLAAYATLFHELTVVVGPRYLVRVRNQAPTWSGLLLAEAGRLEEVRPAGRNPTAPLTAQALWLEEGRALCRARGLRGYSRLTSWTLPAFLHAHLPADVIESHVLGCLRQRYHRHLVEAQASEEPT